MRSTALRPTRRTLRRRRHSAPKLKEMFPHLSFDEAMKTIVRIDRDMHRDPLNTAGQVAAMFGMPITPAAAAADQRVKDLGATIDQVATDHARFRSAGRQ